VVIPRGVFLFFLLFSLIFPSWGIAGSFQGRVIRVFDGDTFLVRVQGGKESVRLREIDAPEVSSRQRAGQEPWGEKARQFALANFGNRNVRLEVDGREERDPYHRLLAYVFIGNLLINQEMVQSGNAFFYPGFFRGKYASRLERAEKKARRAGMGVWDRKNGLLERPWEFRSRTQQKEISFRSLGIP
jgi:endonuclease YncB( thermonuclease family)